MPLIYEGRIDELSNHNIVDKSPTEEDIAVHLDYYLIQNGEKLLNSPINSLYNIFSHPRRRLTKHNLAYELIHEHSRKKDKNISILLPFIDGNKLSRKNLEQSLSERGINNGMMPNIDMSYIFMLESDINRLKRDKHILYWIMVLTSFLFAGFSFFMLKMFNNALRETERNFQQQLDFKDRMVYQRFKHFENEINESKISQNNENQRLIDSNQKIMNEFHQSEEKNKKKFASIEQSIDINNYELNQKIIDSSKKIYEAIRSIKKENNEKFNEIDEKMIEEKEERNKEMLKLYEQLMNKINTNSDNVDETIKQIKDELENLSKRIIETSQNNEKSHEETMKKFNEVKNEIENQISMILDMIKENKANNDNRNKMQSAAFSIFSLISILRNLFF